MGAPHSLSRDGIAPVEHITKSAGGAAPRMVTAGSQTEGTVDRPVLTRYAYHSTTIRVLRMRIELCTRPASSYPSIPQRVGLCALPQHPNPVAARGLA